MSSPIRLAVQDKHAPVPLNESASRTGGTVDSLYARYVLAVLVAVYVFNAIDRQILTILAEAIKADLRLSDSDLGFLFGTAFAVFYAIFGIPLGRVADSWNRTRLISVCVGFWSLMTALSGVVRSFVPLAVCRFGVGVGEAGASPAAGSLLYDYFSPKVRATVVGLYTSGLFIGGGAGLFLGGTVMAAWNNAWPDPSIAPFGLKGWQAAFMVVGFPGLLLAVLVRTLKEPARGQAEGLAIAPVTGSDTVSTAHPARIFLMELLPMLPVINLWLLRREGVSNKVLLLNVCAGIGMLFVAALLIQVTGNRLQWSALVIGFYCAFSWCQMLACRDAVCFGLIFRCKTVRNLYVFLGLNTFAGAAVGFWTIPYFQRYYGVSAAQVGGIIGLSYAVGGLAGTILGGVLADRLRRHTPEGKLYVTLGAILLWLMATLLMLSSKNVTIAYALAFAGILTVSVSVAPITSTIFDLMIPRTRAVAMALYIMIINLMGIALGPYIVGGMSDVFVANGLANGEALRWALLISLIVVVAAIVFLLLAIRHIGIDESTRLERARALGEPILI